jgi:YrbI family 3-deoxy-D-manno-octulosonate 8-phosphate phosphatase
MVEILAIIPARGGSKGIPRKNIRLFAGYPLIAWSIAAARQSEIVTRTLVSTDDAEIAGVARSFGVETPFLRPAEIAQDKTTDLPVFEQALQWLAENENYHPVVVVQLRPTSPIRPPGLVDAAIKTLLAHGDADSVRGVVPVGQNPYKMWRLPGGESAPMTNLLQMDGTSEPYNMPRQVLPSIYWQTGHVDAIRSVTILDKKSMSGEVIYPLVIDPRYAVDLDNMFDWAKYEWLVFFGGLDFISPGRKRRSMPEKISLLVLDFDGVITDNRVWTDQAGHESVASNRSDSEALSRLRQAGVKVMVISKETNPVVAARCQKLNLPFVQGVQEKELALVSLLKEQAIEPDQTVYLGNDTNDLTCFPLVGWAVGVADSHPSVRQAADFILSLPGGGGAIRELCDLILTKRKDDK